LRLKNRKFVAGHWDVGFGVACHIRLVFAIVSWLRRSSTPRPQGVLFDGVVEPIPS
jgi:hypothetical protein